MTEPKREPSILEVVMACPGDWMIPASWVRDLLLRYVPELKPRPIGTGDDRAPEEDGA